MASLTVFKQMAMIAKVVFASSLILIPIVSSLESVSVRQRFSLRYTVQLLSVFLSHVEVFAERAAREFGGFQLQNSIVLVIEMLKCSCRLGCLLCVDGQQSPSMLINWNKNMESLNESEGDCSGESSSSDGNSSSNSRRVDLNSYLTHYQALYLKLLRTSIMHCASRSRSTPSVWPHNSKRNDVSTYSSAYTGRRSGFVLAVRSTDEDKSNLATQQDNNNDHYSNSVDESQRQIQDGVEDTAQEDFASSESHTDVRLRPMHCTDPAVPTGFVSDGLAEDVEACAPATQSRSSTQWTQYWSSSLLRVAQFMHGATSSTADSVSLTPERLLQLGEVTYTLRPLVYVLLLRHFASNSSAPEECGKAESQPHSQSSSSSSNSSGCALLGTISRDTLMRAVALAISLVVEYLSIQLSLRALEMVRRRALQEALDLFRRSSQLTSPGHNEDVESRLQQGAEKLHRTHGLDKELSRRRMALFLYLIRSPLFDRATYPMLKTASVYLQAVPLLGSLPQMALDALSYLNSTHFYNSNS